MITPEAALSACTRAAEAHAADGSPWPQAMHHTVRSLIDRLAAARGLPSSGLKYPANTAAETALDQLGPLDGWHVLDLGEVHQLLLELHLTTGKDGRPTAVRAADQGARATQGSWYTPPEVAQAMCRLSIGAAIDQLATDTDPHQVLNIMTIDPACGAGVFLIETARFIADRYALRLWGNTNRPPALMVDVMRECVFGVDIDPVAVDLARTALWLEVNGSEPFAFMDRNVICGNALAGDVPPAWRERRGGCCADTETRRPTTTRGNH